MDVLVRPGLAARRGRMAAVARKKPFLNVGAGTPDKSIRARFLGPTLWGDVNCDIDASGPCGSDVVCNCDIQKLPFADKQFGAVIASHVLEHVDDPQQALRELHRVADEVIVVTPEWWAPHTWLHPNHLWFRRADGSFLRLRSERDPTSIGSLPTSRTR